MKNQSLKIQNLILNFLNFFSKIFKIKFTEWFLLLAEDWIGFTRSQMYMKRSQKRPQVGEWTTDQSSAHDKTGFGLA